MPQRSELLGIEAISAIMEHETVHAVLCKVELTRSVHVTPPFLK